MSQEHSFVTYLETLAENRGALAALRRGLGQPPGTAPDMYRYVVPVLPQDAYPGSWAERSYYLIAALYATHSAGGGAGNMGNHFAAHLDLQNPDRNDAIERRFIALLTAHPEDLHIYLRQAIAFLCSKETPVNWHQFMWDVLALGYPDRSSGVRKRWADAFWRRGAPAVNAEPGAAAPDGSDEDSSNDHDDDESDAI
jgi:CRISPR system Cascade subunit CasB